MARCIAHLHWMVTFKVRVIMRFEGFSGPMTTMMDCLAPTSPGLEGDPLLADPDADTRLDNVEVAAGSGPVCDSSIPGPTGDCNSDMQISFADISRLHRLLPGRYTPILAEQQLNCAPLVNDTPQPDCALAAGDLIAVCQECPVWPIRGPGMIHSATTEMHGHAYCPEHQRSAGI
jgi:hypothetical protein